jgi:hypothetical protein
MGLDSEIMGKMPMPRLVEKSSCLHPNVVLAIYPQENNELTALTHHDQSFGLPW